MRNMMFMLKPKSGKGCAWYTNSIIGKLVLACSDDGFKSLVDVDNYFVVLNK